MYIYIRIYVLVRGQRAWEVSVFNLISNIFIYVSFRTCHSSGRSDPNERWCTRDVRFPMCIEPWLFMDWLFLVSHNYMNIYFLSGVNELWCFWRKKYKFKFLCWALSIYSSGSSVSAKACSDVWWLARLSCWHSVTLMMLALWTLLQASLLAGWSIILY